MRKPTNGRQPPDIVIRALAATDDLDDITRLIHAAYACRATDNLRYWATHQSVDDTRQRFAAGQGLLASVDGTIVGTLTVRPPQPESPVALYRNPTTWTLAQYAVLPSHQGRGIGRRLHDAALTLAWRRGGRTAALDTAEPASDLIAMYHRWGYRIAGRCDWRPQTNYPSLVMTRTITPPIASANP